MNELIKKGDVKGVQKMLESGCSPNEEDKDGGSPLMCACGHGNADIIQLLLQYGADPNRKSNWEGALPLHFATHAGNVKIIGMLVDAGGDIDALDKHEIPPIMVAMHYMKFKVVVFLWQKGVSMHTKFCREGAGLLTPYRHAMARQLHHHVCGNTHTFGMYIKLSHLLFRLTNRETVLQLAAQTGGYVPEGCVPQGCVPQGERKFTLPEEFIKLLSNIF